MAHDIYWRWGILNKRTSQSRWGRGEKRKEKKSKKRRKKRGEKHVNDAAVLTSWLSIPVEELDAGASKQDNVTVKPANHIHRSSSVKTSWILSMSNEERRRNSNRVLILSQSKYTRRLQLLRCVPTALANHVEEERRNSNRAMSQSNAISAR